MKYTLSKKEAVRECRGINKSGSYSNGELCGAVNLVKSGSSLKTREHRALIRALSSAGGIYCDDSLVYVDSGRFYYTGFEIPGLHLSAGEKRILNLGNYYLIFPDAVYVNSTDTFDYGYLFASFGGTGCTAYTVDSSLREINCPFVESEPEEAAVGDYCTVKDTDGEYTVKRYNGSAWIKTSTYLCLSGNGIGAPFRIGDTLTMSGFAREGFDTFTIHDKTQNAIYTKGVALPNEKKITYILLRRYIPSFDFVTVSGDRLVGVRRGMDPNGNYVCKMYASAPNDPFNFITNAGGLEHSLNISGAFTALCDFLGTPIAFTENEIIEAREKNGTLIASVVRTDGVEQNAHKSLLCANGKLYYKSKIGVCEYDGSYPECISEPLGQISAGSNGCPAGYAKGKYYIKLTNSLSESIIYVFDIASRQWLSQNDSGVTAFACKGTSLYALTSDNDFKGLVLFDWDSATENDKTYLASSGNPTPESDIEWSLESCDAGADSFDGICPIRAVLRIQKGAGNAVRVGMSYNGGESVSYSAETTEQIRGAVNFPLPIRRCDTARLTVSGSGDCEIQGYALQLHGGGAVYGWR